VLRCWKWAVARGNTRCISRRPMPQLVWHTSDVAAHHPGIQMWLDEAGLPNTRAPLALDVVQRCVA
jgi:hypothetical protein